MAVSVENRRELLGVAVEIEKRLQRMISGDKPYACDGKYGNVGMLLRQLIEVIRQAGHTFRGDCDETQQVYAGMAMLKASLTRGQSARRKRNPLLSIV